MEAESLEAESLGFVNRYAAKKRNAPLRQSSIVFNRMNAKVCKFHLSYMNQSCIDVMKVI